MKRTRWLVGLGIAFGWWAALALGDEVASPWGTIHGNNAGTQSSPAASLEFNTPAWSAGAVLAWELVSSANGIDRPAFRAVITFDEDGNVYWRTSTGGGTGGQARIVSVSPAGAVRWLGNDGAGNNLSLGGFDATSVVVGDGGQSGRCYVTSNLGGVGAIQAYRKDTGAQVWSTALPGSGFPGPGGLLLTPVLHHGKLWVMGARAGTDANVYRVNSATGTLEQTTLVGGITADCHHQMAFVPNVFGPGLHGLFFNGDSNHPGFPPPCLDGIAEIFAIRVTEDATPAALMWSAEGGKAGRGHVIYSATTGRLYTHTWNDYCAEFYSWNPVTGAVVANQNFTNDGHGFYDVGCLDFNGTDVVTGAFTGHIIRYHDTGAGATTHETYLTEDWWGELRNVGGLYKDTSGKSVLLSATNSRVIDFGAAFTARVFAADVTDAPVAFNDSGAAFPIDDGPIYVDNLKITGGPTTGLETTIIDTNGFTGYPLGNLPGLENSASGGTGTGTWVLDNAPPSGVSDPTIVSDPTGSGMGNVTHMNAAGSGGGWQGVDLQLPASTTDNVVVVAWDQWRADTGDNVYAADNLAFNGWWAVQWDSAFPMIPRGGAKARQFDGTSVPLTPGAWQHVEYKFDFGAGTVTVTIGANSATEFLDIAGNPLEAALRGFNFEIEGTATTEQAAPITPRIFEWDTGVGGPGIDHGFTVRGGPLLGPTTTAETPEQHIYYFHGTTRNLVAIKPGAILFSTTNPPNGHRDTLQNTDTSSNGQGIGVAGTPSEGAVAYSPISATFSGVPVPAPAPGNITVSCTDIVANGQGDCPSVTAVAGAGAGPYLITLSGSIPVRECITLVFAGVVPGRKLQYSFLPGDTNLNGITTGQDVLSLVGRINNGTANANLALNDINRNGQVTGQDVLRLVQLINGGPNVAPNTGYNGATVAPCP